LNVGVHRFAFLLDDVCELMSQKPSSAGLAGNALAVREDDVMTECVRVGLNGARRFGRRCVVMDTHMSEVAPEARFEECTRGRI
jgi:hypothetical protein